MKVRKLLLSCVISLCAAVPIASLAADAGTADTGTADTSTGDTGTAQSEAQDRMSSLEEVTVTARRREERSQTVPIAITAFSEKSLEQNNIQTITDLQYQVPSLTIGGGFRDTPQVNIRGQGISAAGQNGVLEYLDEVPLPVDRFGQGGLVGGPGLYFDLANLQVLKGPQGTLFGRNSTGGALLLQTKMPTNDFGGYLQVTAGNYNDREIEGALNLPIIPDKLLVRIAANGKTRDGFTRSLGDPSHPNGWDLDNENYATARVTVTFRPTEYIQNDLVYTELSSSNHGTSDFLTSVDPNGAAAALYPGLLQELAKQQALGPRTQIATSITPMSRRNDTFITDTFRYDVTSDIKFRNIFGFMKSRINESLDLDGSKYAIQDYPPYFAPDNTQQWTEEAQFQGSSLGHKLDWVVGAFFLNLPAKPYVYIPQNLLGIANVISHRASERSNAGYAQGTYDLSSLLEGLKFTAGVRYTSDYQFAQAQSLDGNARCSSPPPPNTDANCASTQSAYFHAPTWTLGLDEQITPQTLVYLASRRGYHSGGFNLFGDPAAGHFSVGPEYVTDEELGTKSDWEVAGMQARTNAAVYHQGYSAIQISQTILSPTNIPIFIIANAATASVWGAEFEGTFSPTKNFQLGVLFDWLNFRYTGFGPGVDAKYAEASKTIQRPPMKYGVNARYTLPLDARLGDISASANWTWQSTSGDYSQPGGLQYAFGLLTLGANWEHIGGGPLSASFFMNNALDKTYVTNPLPFTSSFGYSSGVYGPPRMFGFRLLYRFGAEANR